MVIALQHADEYTFVGSRRTVSSTPIHHNIPVHAADNGSVTLKRFQ